MSPLTTSLLFGSLAAVANLFGGLIIIKTDWHREYLKYFLAFGSGFMLAAAFLEMIPESLQLLHSSPAFILSGYLLVHLFEHGFAPHFRARFFDLQCEMEQAEMRGFERIRHLSLASVFTACS